MNQPVVLSDMAFIRSAVTAVRRHLADADFNTTALSSTLGYSRMHVNRRIRAALGCSTGALIRLVRMQCARQLLRQEDLKVSGVARSVGFRSVSHFSHLFKNTWGVSPAHLHKDVRRY